SAVHAGNLGQRRRQPRLVLVIKEIGSVHQQLGLLGQRLGQSGMRVPERVHADAAEQVKVLAALVIVNKNTPALAQQHRVALVGREQQLGFEFLYLLQFHATNTSVPDSILVE